MEWIEKPNPNEPCDYNYHLLVSKEQLALGRAMIAGAIQEIWEGEPGYACYPLIKAQRSGQPLYYLRRCKEGISLTEIIETEAYLAETEPRFLESKGSLDEFAGVHLRRAKVDGTNKLVSVEFVKIVYLKD